MAGLFETKLVELVAEKDNIPDICNTWNEFFIAKQYDHIEIKLDRYIKEEYGYITAIERIRDGRLYNWTAMLNKDPETGVITWGRIYYGGPKMMEAHDASGIDCDCGDEVIKH